MIETIANCSPRVRDIFHKTRTHLTAVASISHKKLGSRQAGHTAQTPRIVSGSRLAYIVTQQETHNKIFGSGDSSNETIRLDFGCTGYHALARRLFARSDYKGRRHFRKSLRQLPRQPKQ